MYTFTHCSNSLTPAAVLPEPETSYDIDVLRMNAEWTDAAVGPRYRATMQRRADAPPSLFDGASCKESIEKSHDAAAIATWQQDLPWLLDPELSSEEELCDISSSSSSSSSRSPPSCRAASAGGGGGAGECTLTVKRYLSHLAQENVLRLLLAHSLPTTLQQPRT